MSVIAVMRNISLAVLLLIVAAHASRVLHASENKVVQWSASPTPAVTVPSGSTVTFQWNGRHDVNRIPSNACPSDFEASDVSEVAALSTGGSYTTPALPPGTYYYACSVGGHCEAGQLLKVTVT
eukprot:jgi/Botrbrau1/18528/Bobra.0412s0003.1